MSQYQPLSPETLPQRLGALPDFARRLGGNPDQWQCREVGDGNLNLVFIVTGRDATLIIKQALPYVRLVGESWPLPLKRSYFEYHALIRQQQRDPGRVPEVHYFDEEQAMIAMEFLTPHVILRHSLINGIEHAGLAGTIGKFMARTLFRGSDLSMSAAARKSDLALFADNAELCDITENLVFSDPYFNAEQNRHTAPQLDALVAELRADITLKVQALHLKMAFCTQAETLLHGDFHTGSVMVHEDDARVIDPEFALYGPIGFDVGMYLSNLLMAACAQPGHAREAGERNAYRDWILRVVADTWTSFGSEFAHLWHTERTGMLYPETVTGPVGGAASEQALNYRLQAIWQDALGFAGVEMHRRILGLAHIIEFEDIADENLRAQCEAHALRLGRDLVVNRREIADVAAIMRRFHQLEQENKQ